MANTRISDKLPTLIAALAICAIPAISSAQTKVKYGFCSAVDRSQKVVHHSVMFPLEDDDLDEDARLFSVWLERVLHAHTEASCGSFEFVHQEAAFSAFQAYKQRFNQSYNSQGDDTAWAPNISRALEAQNH